MIGKIMGKKGGHSSGGHGHGHVAHFYWKKDKEHDIMDLFNKKILTEKDKKLIEKRKNGSA